MTVAAKTLFVCNCNRTMPLDGEALGRALSLPSAPTVHTMLCQRELDQFAAGAQATCSWRARRSSGCWARSPRRAAARSRFAS